MPSMPAAKRAHLSQDGGELKAWAHCFHCEWFARYLHAAYARTAAHDHIDICPKLNPKDLK